MGKREDKEEKEGKEQDRPRTLTSQGVKQPSVPLVLTLYLKNCFELNCVSPPPKDMQSSNTKYCRM